MKKLAALAVLGLVPLAGPVQAAHSPALPARSADGPDGTWRLSAQDSYAGYRIRERLSFLPLPNDAVGRTSVMTGSMTIAGGAITAVDVSANPLTLKSDKSNRDDTVRHHVWGPCPRASFRLTQPVQVGSIALGTPLSITAPGRLTLRCATRAVQFPLQLRWDGDSFAVVGRLQLLLADYGLKVPTFARILSVSKRANLEVQLVWLRQ